MDIYEIVKQHWSTRDSEEKAEFIRHHLRAVREILKDLDDATLTDLAARVMIIEQAQGVCRPRLANAYDIRIAEATTSQGQGKRTTPVPFDLDKLQLILDNDDGRRVLPACVYRAYFGRRIPVSVRSHWGLTRANYDKGIGKTYPDLLPILQDEWERLHAKNLEQD